MRLPFLRSKDTVDKRARPAGGSAEEGPVQLARTRARRRLIGALVLLAAGVLGFPVLFETQPRPLPVDTPIVVPESSTARVASAPALRPPSAVPPDAGNEAATETASGRTPPLVAGAAVASAPTLAAAPVVPAPRAAPKVPAPAPAVAAAVAEATVETEPAKAAPKAAAEAIAAPAEAGRFVVQVGAYNEVERMRAARQKLEDLGYKTYTQDVDTSTGKRTRVRVGPFPSRQEAEKVAARLKSVGMQANILSL